MRTVRRPIKREIELRCMDTVWDRAYNDASKVWLQVENGVWDQVAPLSDTHRGRVEGLVRKELW